MNLIDRVKQQENMHILFWLIKDSCWMLEIKWLGALMVVPTLGIAAWIIYVTRKLPEVYINVAIFFWITANSYWMIMEVFFDNAHRYLAAIPFALGFIFVGLFYLKGYRNKKKATLSE